MPENEKTVLTESELAKCDARLMEALSTEAEVDEYSVLVDFVGEPPPPEVLLEQRLAPMGELAMGKVSLQQLKTLLSREDVKLVSLFGEFVPDWGGQQDG